MTIPTPYTDLLEQIHKRLIKVSGRGNGLFDTEQNREDGDEEFWNRVDAVLTSLKDSTIELHQLLRGYHDPN